MAISSAYLLLAIIIGFLSISTISARPCKTFLISSYTLFLTPENPNPESDFSSSSSSSPRSVTVFTIRRLNPHFSVPIYLNRRNGFLPSAIENHEIENRPQLSIPFISDNINSFKDRTRDILSVVVALLFGVGCGALTAATMYLVWALVMNRNSYDCEEEDDYEGEEADYASRKKLGYVKIPDPAPAPAPVKEAA